MKKLTLFFTLFSAITYAQPKITTNSTFGKIDYSQKNYELSNYNVIYSYKIVKNVKRPDKVKSGLALLQLGNSYNKFVDYSQIEKDSLFEKMSHLSTVNSDQFNEILAVGFKSTFKYQLILDKEKNELTYADNIYSNYFLYKEVLPKMVWKLDKETKQILNYSAKKATVKYAGRNWTAWYTEEIPLQYGPYKFSGLPGLILEIYDDKEHYHFTVDGINQNPKQIYLSQGDKTPVEITKKEFMKAEKNHHENTASIYSGNAVEANGKPMLLNELPYNPIELE